MRVTYGEGFALAPVVPMRERVARLDRIAINALQTECPVRHYFAPGLYAREMTIPADTYVSGAVHKTENLIVVSRGRLRIVTDEGTRDVAAGDTFTCRAGMKNAVVTLEDSRWTNFFANPTNETDTDKLTEILTTSKACELLGGSENAQMLNLQRNELLKKETPWLME